MSKLKTVNETIVSPEQFTTVLNKGIKVYPISKLGSWYIESDYNGKIHRFDKKVLQKDLNTAIAKTIIYYYNQIKENG